MAIERVVLKTRVVGKGFNIIDVAIAAAKADYPLSESVDALEERAHGVRITKGEAVFTIPWEGIAYSQGTDDKKKPQSAAGAAKP